MDKRSITRTGFFFGFVIDPELRTFDHHGLTSTSDECSNEGLPWDCHEADWQSLTHSSRKKKVKKVKLGK
ncbi:hypothetical protein ACIOYV_09795 [Pseudomonas sp. NPDC087342]|uniref:hypothetical protein n=1 Tax=Pseudomonas sp. NPDC087342 TaxID=3364437 RepID=UPI0038274104